MFFVCSRRGVRLSSTSSHHCSHLCAETSIENARALSGGNVSEGRAWSEYARTRRVFILGAGFSAAAGVPMTGTLLATAMETFAAECPGIHERVCNYASEIQWETEENEPD